MSENNKPELIVTEPEVLAPEPYDFEFIASTLGLIPYQALALDDQTTFQGALNPGAVVNLEITEEGHGAFTLHGGEEILMDTVHLTLFEETLKRRIEEQKAKTKEAMRDQLKMQIEIGAEFQSGVQQASGVIVNARGKRGFH